MKVLYYYYYFPYSHTFYNKAVPQKGTQVAKLMYFYPLFALKISSLGTSVQKFVFLSWQYIEHKNQRI